MPVLGVLKLLVGPISSLLEKAIPDKDKREEMAHQIATMAETHVHEIAKMQMEVNKQEAAHKSLFVAGWRPGAGWVCVLGMASNFLFIPMVNTALLLFHVVGHEGEIVQIPILDLTVMLPVLLGMLGLGGMRSYEKKNGVARAQ